MSRTYNLRTRAEVGSANQPLSRVLNDPIPRRRSPSPARDPPPHMTVNPRDPESPAPLYSDVVASRSPSPLKNAPFASIGHTEPVMERFPAVPLQPEIRIVPISENVDNIVGNTPSEINSFPKDPEGAVWTTVERRRTRSLESFDLIQKSRSGIRRPLLLIRLRR